MATALFNTNNDPNAPYSNAAVVTPNDSADLSFRTRALFIGGAGNIVVSIGGANVTITGVLAGSVLPICVDRVLATSTTATNIVALW